MGWNHRWAKMKRKCQACGVEKDDAVLEYYKHDDSLVQNEPIRPLFDLECQSKSDYDDFRIATVCHECFHKLDPDMWIGESCWESLTPVVPFGKLAPTNQGEAK